MACVCVYNIYYKPMIWGLFYFGQKEINIKIPGKHFCAQFLIIVCISSNYVLQIFKRIY